MDVCFPGVFGVSVASNMPWSSGITNLKTPPQIISPARLRLSRSWRRGLRLKDSVEQVLDNTTLALLSGFLDTLDLLVRFFVRLVLCLLVALAVLYCRQLAFVYLCRGTQPAMADGEPGCVWRTSASNFLYSSSFFALYSAISFLASSRASRTRFVRTVLGWHC